MLPIGSSRHWWLNQLTIPGLVYVRLKLFTLAERMGVQRLLQCIENENRRRIATDSPADDTTGLSGEAK